MANLRSLDACSTSAVRIPIYKSAISIIILSGLLAVPDARAQLNKPIEKGYIVTSEMDTLHGYISVVSKRSRRGSISFGEEVTAFREYSPTSAFGYYLAESNQMFVSTRTLPQNPTGSDTFVQLLIDGPAQIYTFLDTTRTRYWIRKEETLAGLQGGSTETKYIGNQSYEVKSTPYLKVLKKTFSDCPLDSMLFEFSSENLVAATEKYNACKGAHSHRFSKEKRGRWVFGGMLGVVSSRLTFIDKETVTRPYEYPSIAPDGSYDLSALTGSSLNSTGAVAGLVISYYPGTNKHFSIVSEVNLQGRQWSGNRVEVKLSYLQLPVAVRYNFLLSRQIQPVLGVGFAPTITTKSDYNSENYVWQFHRASPAQGSDTYPNVLDVPMPTFIEREVSPGGFFPFFTAGFDYHTESVAIYVTYRYEFAGSITQSPIFETSARNQVFVLSITPLKLK